MKVLVIDDSATMRNILERILATLGHGAVHAANGREALRLLEEGEPPDLILLDWNMPELDGPAVLRELLAMEGAASIPVIVVTTESEPRKMEEAVAAGARGFITKPFRSESLARVIFETLAEAEAPELDTP